MKFLRDLNFFLIWTVKKKYIYNVYLNLIFFVKSFYFKPTITRRKKMRFSFGKIIFQDLSLINDVIILGKLRKIMSTDKDIRSAWFGNGVPLTEVKMFKDVADLARFHLFIYMSFLRFIKKDKFSCLDIGTATGFPLSIIAKIWPKASFTGIDYDNVAISFAKKFNKSSNIKYYNQNFLDFKANERYDYIFIMDVLEHVPHRYHSRFINKALSLLKKDGLIFLFTANAIFEKDEEFGHVGVLNKNRIDKFIKIYKKHFAYEGFIIDEYLLSGSTKKFLKSDRIENFAAYQKKNQTNYSSHLCLVLKK